MPTDFESMQTNLDRAGSPPELDAFMIKGGSLMSLAFGGVTGLDLTSISQGDFEVITQEMTDAGLPAEAVGMMDKIASVVINE